MKKLRTVVLTGGWSTEREIALLSGLNVYQGFKRLAWPVVAFDMVPDKGELAKIKAKKAASPWAKKVKLADLLNKLGHYGAEFVFLCLHGSGGEDGCIQGLLELGGYAYSGSGLQASAVAMDKAASKKMYESLGLRTPAWKKLEKGDSAGAFPLPCVVKPLTQGSTVGISIVKKREELERALKLAWSFGQAALVEKYIAGRELTVGVLGEQALPAIEIKPKHEFYDWASKYQKGGSQHLCPAPLSSSQARLAAELGLAAHRALGCRAFSRSDMILDAQNRLWLLETNTLPGMTEFSLLPDAARAKGIGFEQLLVEMVQFSLA